MKRYRKAALREGELAVRYGKDDDGEIDVCFIRGPGVSKSDGRLLHWYLACDRVEEFPELGGPKRRPSLIDELKSRGYDIETIKFSIQKRKS